MDKLDHIWYTVAVKQISEVKMMVTYNPLWDTMKKRGATFVTLEENGICWYAIGRMRRNREITTELLNQLCVILNCNIADIMEYVPDVEKSS